MAELIIFMGPTGAGKSMQAEHMARQLGFIHLSSGDLLRNDPSEAAVMARGDLVVSADVERLVTAAIMQQPTNVTIILDGFPRALDEAQWLDAQLSAWQRVIRTVILFDIDRIVSNKRLMERQRTDDTPEALDLKWGNYQAMTMPVVEHYREHGLLRTVDGNASVDDVFDRIQEILVS